MASSGRLPAGLLERLHSPCEDMAWLRDHVVMDSGPATGTSVIVAIHVGADRGSGVGSHSLGIVCSDYFSAVSRNAAWLRDARVSERRVRLFSSGEKNHSLRHYAVTDQNDLLRGCPAEASPRGVASFLDEFFARLKQEYTSVVLVVYNPLDWAASFGELSFWVPPEDVRIISGYAQATHIYPDAGISTLEDVARVLELSSADRESLSAHHAYSFFFLVMTLTGMCF